MSDPGTARSVLRSILREPTLHFLLLAALLFGAQHALAAGAAVVVEVDRSEVAARIQQIEGESGAPLTPEERQAIEDAYVEERILLREALALGLDDDPRIADFLVQKMLHVLSADVIQPADAELRAYYEANRGRYAPAPAVDIDELVIGIAGPLPPALAAQLSSGAAPEALVRPGVAIRHNPIEGVTRRTLESVFGVETAGMIFTAETGRWTGPHQTVRGQHWFRVTARTGAEPPPLDVVRDQVRLDWIGDEEAARLDRRVKELRARYSVVFVGGSENR